MSPDLPAPNSLPPLTVVGAGKLGSAVAEAWQRRGGTIKAQVRSNQPWEPNELVFEATAPEAAFENVLRCVEAGVPVVTGTTGWLHRLEELEVPLSRLHGTVFWSTNFSPGVHALNVIAARAAEIMSQLEGYTAHIREVHHVNKKDAPSGTALTLKQFTQNGGWKLPVDIESVREGDVVGLHALAWNSACDSVVLQHEAKSRLGFAEGAVWALRWTWERHRRQEFGLYTMTDLFQQ